MTERTNRMNPYRHDVAGEDEFTLYVDGEPLSLAVGITLARAEYPLPNQEKQVGEVHSGAILQGHLVKHVSELTFGPKTSAPMFYSDVLRQRFYKFLSEALWRVKWNAVAVAESRGGFPKPGVTTINWYIPTGHSPSWFPAIRPESQMGLWAGLIINDAQYVSALTGEDSGAIANANTLRHMTLETLYLMGKETATETDARQFFPLTKRQAAITLQLMGVRLWDGLNANMAGEQIISILRGTPLMEWLATPNPEHFTPYPRWGERRP